jgi:hypothetical protein
VVEGKWVVNFGGWSRVETRFMRDCAIAVTVIKWLQSRSGTCRAHATGLQMPSGGVQHFYVSLAYKHIPCVHPGAEMCNQKKRYQREWPKEE